MANDVMKWIKKNPLLAIAVAVGLVLLAVNQGWLHGNLPLGCIRENPKGLLFGHNEQACQDIFFEEPTCESIEEITLVVDVGGYAGSTIVSDEVCDKNDNQLFYFISEQEPSLLGEHSDDPAEYLFMDISDVTNDGGTGVVGDPIKWTVSGAAVYDDDPKFRNSKGIKWTNVPDYRQVACQDFGSSMSDITIQCSIYDDLNTDNTGWTLTGDRNPCGFGVVQAGVGTGVGFGGPHQTSYYYFTKDIGDPGRRYGQRTSGWHDFTIYTSGSTFEIQIDGNLAHSGVGEPLRSMRISGGTTDLDNWQGAAFDNCIVWNGRPEDQPLA